MRIIRGLSCHIYQGYDVSGLGREPMCQLFVVGYEMSDVDVAVVLLDQDILPNLISR